MKISLPRKPDIDDIIKITEKLRNETKVEHLYFVKRNKAFIWFKGYKNYVNPAEEQLLRMNDALVLHNHIQGTSFSYEDIEAIVKYNAVELRILCQTKTYIVKRPGKIWNFNLENEMDFKAYQDAFSEANYLMDILIKKRLLIESERNNYINHFTWKVFNLA